MRRQTKVELEARITLAELELHRYKEQIGVAIQFIPEDDLTKFTKKAQEVNDKWHLVTKSLRSLIANYDS
jgi:hypothetical protein